MPLSLRHQNATLKLMWHVSRLTHQPSALVRIQREFGPHRRHTGSRTTVPRPSSASALLHYSKPCLNANPRIWIFKVGVQFSPHIHWPFSWHLPASLAAIAKMSLCSESMWAPITLGHFSARSFNSYREMKGSTCHAYIRTARRRLQNRLVTMESE